MFDSLSARFSFRLARNKAKNASSTRGRVDFGAQDESSPKKQRRSSSRSRKDTSEPTQDLLEELVESYLLVSSELILEYSDR